jgi:purine-nucleoside phosphorylase
MSIVDDLPSDWVDPDGIAVLRELCGDRIDVAVVLGSGWSEAASLLGEPQGRLSFGEIPGLPVSRAIGHEGVAIAVRSSERSVLILSGRVHHYEGYSPTEVVRGVRTAILAGARSVILTNAAGGVSPRLRPGQLVLLSDHINLLGVSPLTGALQPGMNRFLGMGDCYNAKWRQQVLELKPDLPTGVYAAMPGPQYETPAEVKMLRSMGADLVGMSTVLEAIAANHLGAKVIGVSLVTNVAGGTGEHAFDGDSVVAAGRRGVDQLSALIDLCIACAP